MAQLALAIYQKPPITSTSSKIYPPDIIVISNVFDHLATKGILNQVANLDDPQQIDLFANQVRDFINELEDIATRIATNLGSHTAFATPPGFRQWPRNIQQFMYVVEWVTYNKGLDFSICGANIRVDRFTFRPCELSYPAMFAEFSKYLQSTYSEGNTQLTFNDAVTYDFGMEMAKESFTTLGDKRLRDMNDKEREDMRSESWFERTEGFPPTSPTRPIYLQELQTIWQLTKKLATT